MERSRMKISKLVMALGFLIVPFLIPMSFPDLSRGAAVTLEEPMPDFTLPAYQVAKYSVTQPVG